MAEDTTKIQRSVVHRPNDSGMDLPAGKAADELDRSDYRAVEIDLETPSVARDDDAAAPMSP